MAAAGTAAANCVALTNVRPADPKQRWVTFVRNHAKAIIACDFFVVVTATFQLVYVFFIMEVGTRRLLHFQCHTPPDGRLDAAAVPRMCYGR
jgi:hypothetical protein